MTQRYWVVSWLSILLVLPTTVVVADDKAAMQKFVEQGVRGAFARSPDHFIAAVVQRTSAPVCDVDGLDGCFAQFRVVELLAHRGEGLATPPRQFSLLCGADLGPPRSGDDDLALVFAIPLPSITDVYGAAFMAGRVSMEDRQRFRQIVLDVLAGQPAA